MLKTLKEFTNFMENCPDCLYSLTNEEILNLYEIAIKINTIFLMPNKFETKKFKVLPEYHDYFGSNDDTIIDFKEIYRLSKEWEISFEEILKQLEEC